MPVFEYVALNERGKQIKGAIDAENVRAARQRLRAQKVFPTDIREGMAAAAAAPSRDIKRYFAKSRVSLKDLAVCSRQLATLSGAGLPLVEALEALADQTDTQVLTRILVEVREDVEEGSSFARALGRFPKAFPSLYVNMVASGEASGTLDTVLANLADYLEAQVELRRRIWSALTYPIIMLVLCAAVIVGLLVYVIPKIVEIFEKQGAVLPLPTRMVLACSHFIIEYWYLVVSGTLGGALLMRWYYRQEAGRQKIDRLALRIPIYGRLYVRIASARIARTLSTLLSSGVGLLTALDITRNITSNVHIARALEETRTGVQEGRSLARELARSGIFPTLLSHMIAVGEKSGELESMLDKAGRAYESEVNAALSGLTALLEPLMMIFVGMIVLVIVVSVLLPMADLVTVIQK